jgi:hypothetical protein
LVTGPTKEAVIRVHERGVTRERGLRALDPNELGAAGTGNKPCHVGVDQGSGVGAAGVGDAPDSECVPHSRPQIRRVELPSSSQPDLPLTAWLPFPADGADTARTRPDRASRFSGG